MDDPLIIFEVAVSSSSQIFTKFKRKRFLSDLWLTKQIRHLQNLFLQTVTINDIDIFGDLGSGNFKRQIPTNSLSLFVALLNFSSRSVPCNNFSNVKSEQHYRLRYRLPSRYQNIIVCQMPFQKYEICFFIRKTCFAPDIFKFIYFHVFGPVIVIVEGVNGKIFLKFRRTSIVL